MAIFLPVKIRDQAVSSRFVDDAKILKSYSSRKRNEHVGFVLRLRVEGRKSNPSSKMRDPKFKGFFILCFFFLVPRNPQNTCMSVTHQNLRFTTFCGFVSTTNYLLLSSNTTTFVQQIIAHQQQQHPIDHLYPIDHSDILCYYFTQRSSSSQR